MRILKLCYLFLLILPHYAAAQPPEGSSRAVVGLALSGGGAKGFAHIGVLKVLEEVGISADVVTGTSIGSIFGALYACGYTAAEMESLVVNEDWRPMFDDTPKRSAIEMEQKLYAERYQLSLPIQHWTPVLPSGIIPGQNISQLLDRWCWPAHNTRDFGRLPRSFACVATDLETGEAIVLKSGVLPEAVRASMAIPGVFTAVQLDGHTLVDGGIVRNFPVEDACELGATIVIGVDVGSPLLDAEKIVSFVDILDQTISFQGAAATEAQRSLCNVLIIPDVSNISILDFGQVKQVIAAGEAAARAKLPELLVLADSLHLRERVKLCLRPVPSDTVRISAVKLEGLHRTTEKLVHGHLGIRAGETVTRRNLGRAVRRVYSSTFYERVSYALDSGPTGDTLRVHLVERNTDLLRVGFRYDSEEHAALLVNVTTRNRGLRGTMAVFDARLGDMQEYTASFFGAAGLRPRWAVRVQLIHQRSSNQLFPPGGKRATTLNIRNHSASVLCGPIISTSFLVVGGITAFSGAQTSDSRDRAIPVRKTRNFGVVTTVLWFETVDRLTFSTRGVRVFAQSEFSRTKLGLGADYRRALVTSDVRIPFRNRLTAGLGVDLGWLDEHPPPGFDFSLGGVDDFYGLHLGELTGPMKQSARVLMQWEPYSKKFIVLRANMGNVRDEWRWDFAMDQNELGYGVTFGMLTVAGPIQFTIHDSAHNDVLMHFRFGYTF